jgi:hypothetical protein
MQEPKITVIDCGCPVDLSDPVAVAADELHFARHAVTGADRMRQLGDFLPGNGPAKCAARIRSARRQLQAAEEAWRRLTNEPLPGPCDCYMPPLKLPANAR